MKKEADRYMYSWVYSIQNVECGLELSLIVKSLDLK